MYLDLDLTREVAMSKGRENIDYKVLSSARAKGVTALERK